MQLPPGNINVSQTLPRLATAANQDFGHCEEQAELLCVALALEFGERKFGQQHGMICRYFYANTARPACSETGCKFHRQRTMARARDVLAERRLVRRENADAAPHPCRNSKVLPSSSLVGEFTEKEFALELQA